MSEVRYNDTRRPYLIFEEGSITASSSADLASMDYDAIAVRKGAPRPFFSPDGEILFAEEGSVFIVPADVRLVEFTKGSAAPMFVYA